MNDFVGFIVDNWYVLVAAIALLVGIAFALRHFLKLPTKDQIAKIKEWLLFAVTEAEKELGGGTGQLKLRQVYDLFVQRFPAVAAVISFDTFSSWVDEALEQMREMLKNNRDVAAYVERGILVENIDILEGLCVKEGDA